LLKRDITPERITEAVDWLTGPNMSAEYRFDVLSGDALLKKWDRIVTAMNRPERKAQSALGKRRGEGEYQQHNMEIPRP
jgi:hypothetical protein